MASYSSGETCQPNDLKKLDICQYIFTEGNVEDTLDGDLCCSRFLNDDVNRLDPYWKSYPEHHKTSAMPLSSYETCKQIESAVQNKEIDRKTIFSIAANKGNERIHPRFACASFLFGPIIPNNVLKCLRLMPTPQNYQLVQPPADLYLDPAVARKQLEILENAGLLKNKAHSKLSRPRLCYRGPFNGASDREIKGVTHRAVCLYLHGSGVDGANKDFLKRPEEYRFDYYLHTYNRYWDYVKQTIRNYEQDVQEPLCEPVFFFSNTKYYGWAHDEVQRHYCNAIELLKPKIVFTHSMANPIVAAGIARQLPGCNRIRRRSDDTAPVNDYPVYWESVQGLFKGSAGVIRTVEECIKPSIWIVSLGIKTGQIGFCAPNSPSNNVFQSNYWGLIAPYASMHPQFSNPAIGYGTEGVTPEFDCNDKIYSFSHTQAHYDGSVLQIGLSNLYTPKQLNTPLPQLYLKVQFGFATSYTIFHFYTVLKREGASDYFPPALYKFQLPFRQLYDSLTTADIQNLDKILAKGMVVQLSICGENILVGPKQPDDRPGPKLECYPHSPAGRNHIKLNYAIHPSSKRSTYDRITFVALALDLQPSARPPICKPLMDVAYEYADGGLCGTTHAYVNYYTLPNMESFGLGWVSWAISGPSTEKYTTEVFARDRFNHLFNKHYAAKLSAQDGMVNIDTCSIRPFDSPISQLYTSNPQDPFYETTVNHADGQCYRTDVPANKAFACTWQLNRIKHHVLPRTQVARPSIPSNDVATSSDSTTSSTTHPLTIITLLVEYLNSCLLGAATSSSDSMRLIMDDGGHVYLFYPKGPEVEEEFARKRKSQYSAIQDNLKWLSKSQGKQLLSGNILDNTCRSTIQKLMSLYAAGGESKSQLQLQIQVLIRQISTLMNADYNVPDTELSHQLMTYDQSAASMKIQRLKVDEWDILQSFTQRSTNTIQMTIPFLNIRQLENSYNLNVVQCLSGIGNSNCAYK